MHEGVDGAVVHEEPTAGRGGVLEPEPTRAAAAADGQEDGADVLARSTSMTRSADVIDVVTPAAVAIRGGLDLRHHAAGADLGAGAADLDADEVLGAA